MEVMLGDSLVGTGGTLLAVEKLKRRLLGLPSDRWTLTLDMCRNTRGQWRQKMRYGLRSSEVSAEMCVMLCLLQDATADPARPGRKDRGAVR